MEARENTEKGKVSPRFKQALSRKVVKKKKKKRNPLLIHDQAALAPNQPTG